MKDQKNVTDRNILEVPPGVPVNNNTFSDSDSRGKQRTVDCSVSC